MRVLVAGWAGSSNLGDELIAAALGTRLRGRDVDSSTTSTRLDLLRVGRAVREADAVLLGGGSLIQDVTSPWNMPLHLSRPWLAGLGRTPWAGIGLGVGPIDGRLAKALTRLVLPRAVAVSVRDHASAELLRRLGGPDPVLAADLVLSMPDPHVEVQDRLAVCLRPWTASRSFLPVHLRRTVEETPAWFLDTAARALDETARATGLAVHFVALQADRDGPLHDRIADRMSTGATTSTPTLSTVVDEIATGRVVVAMRYHGGIAAALGGRPCVLVGYSPKVPSLAQDLAPAATSLAWHPEHLARLPAAVGQVVARETAMVEARERLRLRERQNDLVLDRLFEAARS